MSRMANAANSTTKQWAGTAANKGESFTLCISFTDGTSGRGNLAIEHRLGAERTVKYPVAVCRIGSGKE